MAVRLIQGVKVSINFFICLKSRKFDENQNMAKNKDEKKSLEEVLKELDKDYGKGSVINGGESESYTGVISTGSIGLDHALGIGGLPKGKMIEIYGWESSGKSTLVQTIIGNAQKEGVKCLYVDGENSLDETYAKNLGVNLDDMLLIQLDEHAGEGAYNKAERLIATGQIGLVVFDSQNSLQPKKILEDEVGVASMGVHARMLGQVVVKMNALAIQHNCTVIFISQLREKIGVMFGSPETTQGGNALKFYSHVRLDCRKSLLKEGDVNYANKTKIKVVKNKCAIPFKTAEFEIVYGVGIDKIKELIEIGSDLEILRKWGPSITYADIKYTVEEFTKKLKESDFYNEIRTKILEKWKI